MSVEFCQDLPKTAVWLENEFFAFATCKMKATERWNIYGLHN